MRKLAGRALDPSLRLPRAPRLGAVRRPWLASRRQARVSVWAGVPLDDFLRSRLARYLAALPVPYERLPLAVAVADGRVVAPPVEVAPASAHAPEAPPADELQRWLAPLVALEGPEVQHEVVELEIRLSVLEAECEAARRRTDELSRRLAADVAGGTVAAPPAIEATAEQMGRQPVRSSSPYFLLLAFLGATLVATTWQVALPLLRVARIDARALGAAFEERPGEVVFAALFALGISAGLFALADAALSTAVRLFRGDDGPRQRGFLAAGAAAAAAFSVLVGTALAALRPAPDGTPGWAFIVLLLVLPLGSALLLRFARADAARRAAEEPAALAWDRERARALAERARRLAEIDWARGEVRELERARELARLRLQELEARAIDAALDETEAIDREKAELFRLAESLVAALELDRLEFIRQASARGHVELFTPPLPPPAPEPRPAFDEEAADETGRLAS